MSKTHIESISCPECGTSADFKVYDSINVSNDPKLKILLLEGELTTFICPNCNYDVQVSSDLLYHDMDKKIFIWLKYPDGNQQPSVDPRAEVILGITEGYNCRLVTSLNDLIEKILVFDDGYDDLDIEVLKALVTFTHKIDLAHELLYKETKVSLLRKQSLVFVEIGNDALIHSFSRKSQYPKAQQLAARLRPEFDKLGNRWQMLTRQAVLEVMEKIGWLKQLNHI